MISDKEIKNQSCTLTEYDKYKIYGQILVNIDKSFTTSVLNDIFLYYIKRLAHDKNYTGHIFAYPTTKYENKKINDITIKMSITSKKNTEVQNLLLSMKCIGLIKNNIFYHIDDFINYDEITKLPYINMLINFNFYNLFRFINPLKKRLIFKNSILFKNEFNLAMHFLCTIFNSMISDDNLVQNYIYYKIDFPIFLSKYQIKYNNALLFKPFIEKYDKEYLITSSYIYCLNFNFKKFNEEVLKKCNNTDKINAYNNYSIKIEESTYSDKYNKIFNKFNFNDIKEFYL